MLKQETYEIWATTFETSIGVAETLRYIDDGEEAIPPVVYSKFKSVLSTNKKILRTIEDGKYEELQREIYKISRGDKRLKENTIIKRAFDKIYGKERISTKE